MHLATRYAKLDLLYDRVTDAQSVAEARRIMRSEFFPTLAETTSEMFAIADDDRFVYVIEHERTQLAVCRKACSWSMDQMMAEYNKALEAIRSPIWSINSCEMAQADCSPRSIVHQPLDFAVEIPRNDQHLGGARKLAILSYPKCMPSGRSSTRSVMGA